MVKRPLFNRKYAVIGRKAALEEAKARSIKKDSDGFEDIDEFFKLDNDLENKLASLNQKRKSDHNFGQPTNYIHEYQEPIVYSENSTGEERSMHEAPDQLVDQETNLHETLSDYKDDVNMKQSNYDQAYENWPDYGDDNILEASNYNVKEELMDKDEGLDSEISFSSSVKIDKSPSEPQTLANQSIEKSVSRKAVQTEAKQEPKKSKPEKRRTIKSSFKPLVKHKHVDSDDEEQSDMNGGTRKSKRERFSPLKFWINEKVVYGRRDSVSFPVITRVVKQDEPEDIAAKNKPKRTAGKKATNSILKVAGYSAKVRATIDAMNYDTGLTEKRVLAISEDQLTPDWVPNETFKIQTVMQDGNFISAGALVFPPGSEKPSRNSAKHALVFFVARGSFEVTIHESNLLVGENAIFCVPRGNQYSIRSTFEKGDGLLYFCHCKDNSI